MYMYRKRPRKEHVSETAVTQAGDQIFDSDQDQPSYEESLVAPDVQNPIPQPTHQGTEPTLIHNEQVERRSTHGEITQQPDTKRQRRARNKHTQPTKPVSIVPLTDTEYRHWQRSQQKPKTPHGGGEQGP